MEMHRQVLLSVIDESDDGFSAPFHSEGRAGRYPIITNQFGGLEARIDLLGEWLDLNLVIIDIGIRRLIVIMAIACQRGWVIARKTDLLFGLFGWRQRKRILVKGLVFWTQPGFVPSPGLAGQERCQRKRSEARHYVQ
jgi:hypothetical protein